MSGRKRLQTPLAVLVVFLTPVGAIDGPYKISSFGNGVQIWFEAEAFDERFPPDPEVPDGTHPFFPAVQVAGASKKNGIGVSGLAITHHGGPGGMIRYDFNISDQIGGKGGTWYFWGRIINPSNKSSYLLVEGDPNDVIPECPPFPGGDGLPFDNGDDRVFEENAGPPFGWSRQARGEGHVKELQDGWNSMALFHRQGSFYRVDQGSDAVFWDVFLWTNDPDYVPSDGDYGAAVEIAGPEPQFDGIDTRCSLTPRAFRIDPPTLHSLGFRWYFGDDDPNGNAVCTLEYRKVSDGPGALWLPAQDLLRVNRETVDRTFGPYTVGNLFAGSVLFLEEDTEYEVRLRRFDPDGGGEESRTERARTRKTPEAPEPLRTLHLYPPDWARARNSPAYSDVDRALGALRGGDLLLVYPGVHRGGASRPFLSGEESRPIVIRGVGPEEAILQTTNPSEACLRVDDSSFLFIEDLTLEGGAYGILARRADHLVVRNCKINPHGNGICNDRAGSENWYIADNVITGSASQWYPRNPNGHALGTGVKVFGRGHVVEFNQISDFWDCLTIASGLPTGGVGGIDHHTVAIDFNNNDLFNAMDDTIQTDFGVHNIRVWRNRSYNAHTALSTQPFYGGPCYLLRNESYNITELSYKFHNWPAGIIALHNTSFSARQGFFSAPRWQNTTIVNNLILGVTGYSFNSGSPDLPSKIWLDYNGYRKALGRRLIRWSYAATVGSSGPRNEYMTLDAFFRGEGHAEHSILVDVDNFEDVALPVEGTSYTAGMFDLRLRHGAAAIDAGVRLANINDDFSGDAPDLGAHEFNRALPHYGPRSRPFIHDTISPEIRVNSVECSSHLQVSVPCRGPSGAVVSFEVTATDDLDPNPTVECTPASGSVFPPGSTSVTCIAEDSQGNRTVCEFAVMVVDTTPPALNCPAPMTLDCASPEGASVDFTPTAIDSCDASPVVTSTPASGSIFPVGTTMVTSTATDASGNRTTCTFEVTVTCDSGQVPGDCNQDGRLDIVDGLCLLRLLFLDRPSDLPCEKTTITESGNLRLLDANGNGGVDVSDVIHMMNYLFLRGPGLFLGDECTAVIGCPATCRG